MDIAGKVNARIIEVRFASSGKIVKVNKCKHEQVHKGELLASLDRKLLQARLDRQLADYEKIRADFEIFASRYPQSPSEVDKYFKTEKQAMLNSSVKEVEISKLMLDDCDLFSPVDGTVMEDSQIVSGMNITPASAYFKLIDNTSYYVEALLDQGDYKNLSNSRQAKVFIDGTGMEYSGQTGLPYSAGKGIYIAVGLPDGADVLLGMTARISV